MPNDATPSPQARELIERIRAQTEPLVPKRTDAEARLEPITGIRAVLFDIYGTLVISGSGDIGLSAAQPGGDPFRDALGAAGIDVPDLPVDLDGRARLHDLIRAEHARARMDGVRFPEVDIADIWLSLLHDLAIDATSDDASRLAVEFELRVNPVWPMPGLARLLADLRNRGLILGIVSNAQFYTPLMLEAFLHRSLPELGFDPACCAWSYALREAKPSRGIYRAALCGLKQHHGITPRQVLYIGNDMRNDVWPAAAEGCRTVLFAGDARSLRLRTDDPDLAGVTPDRVVTALAEISDVLLAHASFELGACPSADSGFAC